MAESGDEEEALLDEFERSRTPVADFTQIVGIKYPKKLRDRSTIEERIDRPAARHPHIYLRLPARQPPDPDQQHLADNVWELKRDVITKKTNSHASTGVSLFQYVVNAIGQRTDAAQGGPAPGTTHWDYDALLETAAAHPHDAAFRVGEIELVLRIERVARGARFLTGGLFAGGSRGVAGGQFALILGAFQRGAGLRAGLDLGAPQPVWLCVPDGAAPRRGSTGWQLVRLVECSEEQGVSSVQQRHQQPQIAVVKRPEEPRPRTGQRLLPLKMRQRYQRRAGDGTYLVTPAELQTTFEIPQESTANISLRRIQSGASPRGGAFQ